VRVKISLRTPKKLIALLKQIEAKLYYQNYNFATI
jgi:hypothetical protein